MIPTDPNFKDPNRAEKGQIQLNEFLPIGFVQRHINQVTAIDVNRYATGSTDVTALNEGVARDVVNEVQVDCKNAHISQLVFQIYGFAQQTFDWGQKMLPTAIQYDPVTTGLNGDHFAVQVGNSFFQPWGSLVSQSNFAMLENGQAYLPYTTSVWANGGGPITACNAGLSVSGTRGDNWGFAALNDFKAPAFTSNPHQNFTAPIPRRENVVLTQGSSALLTVSGINETPSLDLNGGVEIALSNCSEDGSSCTATLDALTLFAGPFSFQGYDVAGLTINQVTASGGTLVGNTLVFTSLSGKVRATLTDGRYSDMAVQTGVILATWNQHQRKAVMAFAFDSTLGDGTKVTVNGTAFGSFDNIAPSASIAVTSPAATSSADEAIVECQSPSGTTVTLDGSASSDQEDGLPKLAWWENDFRTVARKSTSTQLVLSDLALGSQDVLLMAYDSRGFAADDRLKVTVVDTLPPTIIAPDMCVFPPDKKEFCVRVGQELQVEATDQCDGPISNNVHITNVTSATGTVVSFDGQEACLIADRSGTGTGTTYEITLSASDQNGNNETRTMSAIIPHNGPTKQCLQQSRIQRGVR